MKNKRTALYRHFDENDRLLYVGISLSATERLAHHANESPWFEQIATVRFEWFSTREQALEAERLAIRSEKPIFNKMHNRVKLPPDLGEVYGFSADGRPYVCLTFDMLKAIRKQKGGDVLKNTIMGKLGALENSDLPKNRFYSVNTKKPPF